MDSLFDASSHPQIAQNTTGGDTSFETARKKKRILLILTVGGIIFVTLFVFYILTRSQSPTTQNQSQGGGDLPVGEIRGSNFILPKATTTTQLYTETSDRADPILINIWDKPIGGYCVRSIQYISTSTSISATGTISELEKKATGTQFVFIDKGTGYVYGYITETNSYTQLSNTRISRLFDAGFTNGCNTVLVRQEQADRSSLIGSIYTITPLARDGQPVDLSLIMTITDPVTALTDTKNGSRLAYLTTRDGESRVYEVMRLIPEQKEVLRFTSWNLTYGGNTLYRYTRPTAYLDGNLIKVSTKQNYLGNKTGLASIVSPDNTFSLSSMNTDTGIKLFSTNLVTGSIRVYNARSLVEKCATDPSSTFTLCGVPVTLPEKIQGYPDDWYMGFTDFTDEVGLFGLSRGEEQSFYHFTEDSERTFDIVSPSVSSDGVYYSLINKKDLSLWTIHTMNLRKKRNS